MKKIYKDSNELIEWANEKYNEIERDRNSMKEYSEKKKLSIFFKRFVIKLISNLIFLTNIFNKKNFIDFL